RRSGRRRRARVGRRVRRRHLRGDDGHEPGVPAAAHRDGVRPLDRNVRRPRRGRCGRARAGRGLVHARHSDVRRRRCTAPRNRARRDAPVVAQSAGSRARRRRPLDRLTRMTSAREFFESLESRVDESKTAGMSNSYLFDIEGAGKWKVDVNDGKVSVSEGGEDADAVISTNEETFEQIASGEQNPTSAYMTGKLKVKGDMGAAMKLQKLF